MKLRRYRDSLAEIESGVPQDKLSNTGMLGTVLQVQVKRARGEA